MMRRILQQLCAAVGLLVAMECAHATYTITIGQRGADVMMLGSGSLDTTGLAIGPENAYCDDGGYLRDDLVCMGGLSDVSAHGAFTPPLSGLNGGASFSGSVATGPVFVVLDDTLFFPSTYVSGAPISNSVTFSGQTLASMGLTLGTVRTLSLPSGDKLVIQVAALPPPAPPTVSAIPTLGKYLLMALTSLLAMSGLFVLERKRV